MIVDSYLDRLIAEKLLVAERAKRQARKPSGKLSASMLGLPLQWQILKVLGVGDRDHDAYTLGKFGRGNQVEDYLMQFLEGEQQKFCEYRGVIGYADIILDTSKWSFPHGVVPAEVKSVTGMKFRRIKSQGADIGHILQTCLYALSQKAAWFPIIYMASDDLRPLVLWYKVDDYKDLVDRSIDNFNNQFPLIPAFTPFSYFNGTADVELKWQSDKKYRSFPDWFELTAEQCMAKLEKDYPDIAKSLTSSSISAYNQK